MGGVREGGVLKKELTKTAQKLRNNLTEAEKRIWSSLRFKDSGFKFRRQAPIGKFIVDFVCFEKKLVIELDGGQHAESLEDKFRDEWLRKQGFIVIRFWNSEVFQNYEGVVEKIFESLR